RLIEPKPVVGCDARLQMKLLTDCNGNPLLVPAVRLPTSVTPFGRVIALQVKQQSQCMADGAVVFVLSRSGHESPSFQHGRPGQQAGEGASRSTGRAYGDS